MFGHTKAQEGGLAHPKCPLPLITLIDTWIRTMRTRPSVAHTTEKSRQGQCRPCCVAGGMGVLCILDPFCVLYHVFCIPVPGRSPGAGRLRRTARWRKTCPLLRICKYPSLFAMVDEYPMTSHVFVPGLRKNCNRTLIKNSFSNNTEWIHRETEQNETGPAASQQLRLADCTCSRTERSLGLLQPCASRRPASSPPSC